MIGSWQSAHSVSLARTASLYSPQAGHSFVNRVWRSHGLKPHLIWAFKPSNAPRFAEKQQELALRVSVLERLCTPR